MRTSCPYCGSDTGIDREVLPDLGSLSLEEFETLVRNEWRRRLRLREARGAYGRRHPRKFIRSLIELPYGLARVAYDPQHTTERELLDAVAGAGDERHSYQAVLL